MAMRKYHRVGFTAAQSAELWERWKKGEGLKSIVSRVHRELDNLPLLDRGIGDHCTYCDATIPHLVNTEP